MGIKSVVSMIFIFLSLHGFLAQSVKKQQQDALNFLSELNGKEVEPTRTKDHDHSKMIHGDHGDHSGHGGHEGHMMKMWFHGGFDEVILFDFWRTDSLFSLLLSCLVIFVMGATYEGIKWFRMYLQYNQPLNTYIQNKSCAEIPLVAASSSQSTNITGGHQNVSRNSSNPNKIIIQQSEPYITTIATRRPSPFSSQELIQGFLYILQLIIAYWLMLITMTYNVYLTAAVVLGAGFGHWLFAVLQLRNNAAETAECFETDACH